MPNSQPRLVLDTNVVLDLLHFADPAATPVLAALESGEARCHADALALDELARVVAYPALALSVPAGQALVERYRRLAVMTERSEPPPGLPRCRDPDDQKFIELAVQVGADLLVSKDKALLGLRGRQGLAFSIVGPVAAGAWLAERISSRR